ncbi:gamma-glutamylputrescine oxidase [Rhodovulum imhoffii]|uniref:Gamma-glutamylputrescine oxidase n=1 Tax=Rhodovulum imhoffii TaxID=365340 RepID=A0A2T5BU72_9RHOB|nr:FAD-binding oxidoreductase [Rhodovulum imhoffii]MBK5932754.1 FAD-dependent oxidoreductase [Rhodovulum imhoffii]PTN02961.1 gamma-glutamylputrescine oxidase [Rhodovulum imhoffii]
MDILTANDTPGHYPPSYYAARATPLPPFPAAQGALHCDVCVVGGGYTGLSAALHLAGRGYDVLLVEAQRVGFGASGRNGGQAGQGQRLDQEELEKILGQEHARALWRLANDAVALVRDLAGRKEVRTTFHPGVIHADHKPRHARHSRAYAEKLATDYGYDKIRFLDRREIRARVASPLYHGGTLDMGAGHLDPLEFALGLARLAKAAGVRIHEGSRVLHIEKGAPARIVTDTARITASHVVLACNGYLGKLEPRVAHHVMPINNYIVATEPLGARQAEIIRDNTAVADSKFVINYFRFSDDHRLLFGGTESYGYRFPRDIAAKVRRPLAQVFPQLADVRLDYAWGGTLGITLNRMPYFTRLSGNMLSLSGYSGHGLALATLAGQIAAEAIAGQAERFDLMASVPTLRFPGGPALRHPLLVLGMIWFSLRDRL